MAATDPPPLTVVQPGGPGGRGDGGDLAARYGLSFAEPDWLQDVIDRYGLHSG
jgi:hypothetical protein